MGLFEDLSADDEFCQALGCMTLAASRLESDMRAFLALHQLPASSRATFGQLITQLRQNHLVSDNGQAVLRGLRTQCDYLTHSLYDLFAARIGASLMLREELEDRRLLAEGAWVLEQNLNGLAEIAEDRIVQFKNGELGDALLLSP